jgi:serine protease Do
MKRISTTAFALALCLATAAGAMATDRSHAKVRAAFHDVVAQPHKSTVQIYADGYRAALGAVVRADGYVVTKASELKGKIECEFADKAGKLEATVVARDPAVDLAVLKVDRKELPEIAWAESAPPVGSWLATPVLHIDQGEPVVVGVLSVPARKLAAPSGALGIQLAGRDDAAQIEAVVPDMAAHKAGLKAGDIVTQINDKPIASRVQLVELVRGHMPGETIELRIKRGEETLTVRATLGSLSSLIHGDRADFQNSLGGSLSSRRAGFPMAIQHDTVLKPSECGGPVVDLDGKAIGLNIARAGRVESYALPAAVVQSTVAKLLETHLTAAPSEPKLVEKTPAEK